jgi:hypothetical protein
MVENLTARMHVSRRVRLLQSTLVDVPTMLGAFKPLILLPLAAATAMPLEALEALLAHELAHIRRHDYLVNLLQSVTETLLFYHPAVWWISAQIRQEREHCCDDLAIALTGNRLQYAKALASMESMRTSPRRFPPQLSLAARGAALLPRIRRLLGQAPPRTTPIFSISSVTLTIVFFGSALYVGGHQLSGQAQADSTMRNILFPTARPIGIASANPVGGTPAPTSGQASPPAGQATQKPSLILVKALLCALPESDLPADLKPGDAGPNAWRTTGLSNEKDLAAKIKELGTAGKLEVISRPYMLLNVSQAGKLQIASPMKVTTGYHRANPADATSAWVPDEKDLGLGFSLSATATIPDKSAPNPALHLKLDFHVSTLSQLDYQPAPDVPADKNLKIAVPTIDTRELSSELALADGDTVMIVGNRFTGEFLGAPSKDPKAPAKRLILMITLSTAKNEAAPATAPVPGLP